MVHTLNLSPWGQSGEFCVQDQPGSEFQDRAEKTKQVLNYLNGTGLLELLTLYPVLQSVISFEGWKNLFIL